MCFRNILKISHSNYLLFCSILTVKIASKLLFKSFYCLLFTKKNLWINNLKTRAAINVKIAVFLIWVEPIIIYFAWPYVETAKREYIYGIRKAIWWLVENITSTCAWMHGLITCTWASKILFWVFCMDINSICAWFTQ